MLLAELTAAHGRLALVGLAKNTGKTVALNALLAEIGREGRPVGVTSVGRDGEEHDAIDFRIDKPRVHLAAGSLVATTDGLLRSSGLPHEVLQSTDVRTPLGRVLLARLRAAGHIEVAGPSAAEDVRAVADEMLEAGAAQVLIDGAIDRRAASSPRVADGLVISTGAVLSTDPDEVVARTRDAVELVRLPTAAALAQAGGAPAAGPADVTGLLDGEGAVSPLRARWALTADEEEVATVLREHPSAAALQVAGALPEPCLEALARAARRQRRELAVIAPDTTHVFLHEHGPSWYERQGLRLCVRSPVQLLALTVNPVAPQSHSFDSAALRALLREAIADLPVLDVMHPEYLGAQGALAG